jgi:hypothetical protein
MRSVTTRRWTTMRFMLLLKGDPQIDADGAGWEGCGSGRP